MSYSCEILIFLGKVGVDVTQHDQDLVKKTPSCPQYRCYTLGSHTDRTCARHWVPILIVVSAPHPSGLPDPAVVLSLVLAVRDGDLRAGADDVVHDKVRASTGEVRPPQWFPS